MPNSYKSKSRMAVTFICSVFSLLLLSSTAVYSLLQLRDSDAVYTDRYKEIKDFYYVRSTYDAVRLSFESDINGSLSDKTYTELRFQSLSSLERIINTLPQEAFEIKDRVHMLIYAVQDSELKTLLLSGKKSDFKRAEQIYIREIRPLFAAADYAFISFMHSYAEDSFNELLHNDRSMILYILLLLTGVLSVLGIISAVFMFTHKPLPNDREEEIGSSAGSVNLHAGDLLSLLSLHNASGFSGHSSVSELSSGSGVAAVPVPVAQASASQLSDDADALYYLVEHLSEICTAVLLKANGSAVSVKNCKEAGKKAAVALVFSANRHSLQKLLSAVGIHGKNAEHMLSVFDRAVTMTDKISALCAEEHRNLSSVFEKEKFDRLKSRLSSENKA